MYNVLHVIPSLRAGGAESVLHYMMLNWPTYARRSRLHVLSFIEGGNFYDQALQEGLPVTTLGMKETRELYTGAFLPRLAHMLRKSRFDLIHCHLTYGDFFTVLAARAVGFSGPLMYTEHNVWNRRRRPWFRPFDLVLSRQFDRTIAVSQMAKDAYCRWNRLPQSHMHVIHNGIPVDRFVVGERQGNRIVHVGRFEAAKNHHNLLTACGILKQSGRSFELWLVGDGPLRPSIEAQIRELDLESHVKLWGIARDVAGILTQADLFTLPSDWEGLPISLLEAMASGLPVVASRVGGVPEAVTDPAYGTLVPPADPEALARALDTYLDDRKLRIEVGNRARRHIEQEFSIQQMIEGLESNYLEVLQDRSGDDRTVDTAVQGTLR